jgi:hypothetical protein
MIEQIKTLSTGLDKTIIIDYNIVCVLAILVFLSGLSASGSVPNHYLVVVGDEKSKVIPPKTQQ